MEPAHQSQCAALPPVSGRVRAALSVTLALAAGLALRLWMMKEFFEVNGDSNIYGELAKNLLQKGCYGLTQANGQMHPTLMRLPGYPLFLALCFRVFGIENYAPAVWVQIALDLVACLLLAGFVHRVAPPALRNGAAHSTLWLAALCPFTALYAVQPLTEAPTIFCIALALWSAACFRARPAWSAALAFTFAATCAALLRPDGALVALALAPALLITLRKRNRPSPAPAQMPAAPGLDFQTWETPNPNQIHLSHHKPSRSWSHRRWPGAPSMNRPLIQRWDTAIPAHPHPIRIALVCLLLALAPFAAWTVRNWQVFHVFQPLAPRYANDPGQAIYPGWQRWFKSWSLDFVSTYDVYWQIPGNPLDLGKLPSRAFDSPQQYAETAALAADYNQIDNGLDILPELDARFARLADARIASHPWRSHVWLPLGRVADMWLRPRVENLPIDLDWWVYAHHNQETRFSWAYAALNAVYLLLGIAGLCLRPRLWLSMLAYMLLRSAMLLTIEAPEARYTIECFPILFALAGVALYRSTNTVCLSVFRRKASAGKG